jgi:hypothetical protein
MVCINWPVWYVDSGYGEDYLATTPPGDNQFVPAAFAWLGIWAPGIVPPFDNWLDKNGCTGWFTAPASTWLNYTIWTHSGNANTQIISYFTSTWTRTWYTASFQTPSYSGARFEFDTAWSDANMQTQAIGGWALNRNQERMQNVGERLLHEGTYRIGNGYRNAGCSVPDANVADGWLYTGPLYTGDGSNWKFVVGHELGHCTHEFGAGLAINPTYMYNEVDEDHQMCRCDQCAEYAQHCLQSREYLNTAGSEGYGDFFASRIFNKDNTWGGATFVNCKPFLPYEGAPEAEYIMPPHPFTAYEPQRWMLSYCSPQATSGVEWDWLTFYYVLTARNQPDHLALSQLDMIYAYACTGNIYGKCHYENPSWTALDNSSWYLRTQGLLTPGQDELFYGLAYDHGVAF